VNVEWRYRRLYRNLQREVEGLFAMGKNRNRPEVLGGGVEVKTRGSDQNDRMGFLLLRIGIQASWYVEIRFGSARGSFRRQKLLGLVVLSVSVDAAVRRTGRDWGGLVQ